MKELLLKLSRYPFDQKDSDLLRKLTGEVKDWNGLINLINAHGIIALAAYNIKEAGLDNEIPSSALSLLRDGMFKSITRNIWLKERWKEADTILSGAGIKYILLKGMALEYSLYGSMGLRQMNDNDILISPDSAINAVQLLRQNGFVPAEHKSPLFKKITPFIGQHLPALYKNGYSIEIHTHLSGCQPANSSETENYDTNEILIDNRKALILKKDIHVKYLISHFKKHARSGECQLRLYADISLLDNSYSEEFPGAFLYDPIQSHKLNFRITDYKDTVRSIPPRYRIYFILGDMFPSPDWMKKRYKCSGLKTLMYYPPRIAKLKWLF